MSEAAAVAAPAVAEESVLIFHTGKGHGPMSTAAGDLLPGQSLDVPAALAARLTGAYAHIKLAKDVIPGGGADKRTLAENVALKAEIAALAKKLEDAAAAAPTPAAAGERIAKLEDIVRAFLAAGSKKDMEALQAEHADAVPAAPESAA